MNIEEIVQFAAGTWVVVRPMLIISLCVGAFAVWFSIANSLITPKPTLNGGK